MNTQIEEYFRPLNLQGFSELYQISSIGRVRSKEYKFWKDGELKVSKGRILKVEDDKSVYLRSRVYNGFYNVGILYKHSFPNTTLV